MARPLDNENDRRTAARHPCPEPPFFQPSAADAGLILSLRGERKEQARVNILRLHHPVEVVQEDLNLSGVEVRQSRQRPQVRVAKMAQAQHPQFLREKLDWFT